MPNRIDVIVSYIKPCKRLADIGCDHGYVTEKCLKIGKCESAVISDISESCLKKAQTLLSDYLKKGIVKAYVADGFCSEAKTCDGAVIAGMGGEEIVKILTDGSVFPEFLYLQPMKNSEKVRKWLIDGGYKITNDFTFKDVKFYDYITAERSKEKEEYSPLELVYGRDNLKEKSDVFKEKLALEREILKAAFVKAKTEESKACIEANLKRIDEVLK